MKINQNHSKSIQTIDYYYDELKIIPIKYTNWFCVVVMHIYQYFFSSAMMYNLYSLDTNYCLLCGVSVS